MTTTTQAAMAADPPEKRMAAASLDTTTNQNISSTDISRPETAFNQALIAAASQALPLGELEMQALGSKSAWGTNTRPGRIAARTLAIRCLARMASMALAEHPDLEPRHVEAALRSMAIRAQDILIDSITGSFMAPKPAIRNRAEEVSRAIAQLAWIIKSSEEEAP